MNQKLTMTCLALLLFMAPSLNPLSANLAGSDTKKPQKTPLGKCQDAADAYKADCEARCTGESSSSTEGGGTSGGGTTTAGVGKLSAKDDQGVRDCLDHCDSEFRRMQEACYKRNPPTKKL